MQGASDVKEYGKGFWLYVSGVTPQNARKGKTRSAEVADHREVGSDDLALVVEEQAMGHDSYWRPMSKRSLVVADQMDAV